VRSTSKSTILQSTDDDPLESSHPSSFHSVLHEYYSSQSGSGSSSTESGDDKDDKNDKRKSDSADQSQTLTVPDQPADKPREILPLMWAFPFSRDNATLKDTTDSGPSGQPALVTTATAPSVTPADSSKDSEDPSIDERPASPPKIDMAQDAAPPTTQPGPIAFAARLTPADQAAPTTDPGPKAQAQSATAQTAQQANPKEIAEAGPEPSEPDGSRTVVTPPAPPVATDQPPASPVPKTETAPANAPTTARIENTVEPPAAPSGSNHDITVRVPDATERGMDIRFVERAGEVRVSVRTGDAELAQTLRGGLNDFVGRLEQGGIRAEVWRPGSDAGSSPNDSQNNSQQQPPADQRGSGRNQPGTQDREEQRRDQRKPAWVEEVEKSFSLGTTGKE
jgi:hypothetical protein